MNILVIGYANKKCANVHNWNMSMEKYGYRHIVIGHGEKWKGFMTKIRGYRKHLVDAEGGGNYDLVILCDVFDFYACGPSSELEKRYKAFNCDLLVGAEETLWMTFIPITEYWKHHKSKNNRRYVNSGFMMGSPDKLIEVCDFILGTGLHDDQVALAHYCNKYPAGVSLDQEQSIVSNVILSMNVFKMAGQITCPNWDRKNVRSLFVHTPFMKADFNQRYIQFGRNILGDDFLLPGNDKSFVLRSLIVGFIMAAFILLIYFNVQLGIMFLVVAIIVMMYLFTNS